MSLPRSPLVVVAVTTSSRTLAVPALHPQSGPKVGAEAHRHPDPAGHNRHNPGTYNNEMKQTNREVTGLRCVGPCGEPGLAEVGPTVILSLDLAAYLSVGLSRSAAVAR